MRLSNSERNKVDPPEKSRELVAYLHECSTLGVKYVGYSEPVTLTDRLMKQVQKKHC